mgnify:CR=1 FL=1
MDILNQDVPLWVVVAYLIYGAVIQALPRPGATEGKAYTFLYGFAHALANNFALAYSPRKAGPKPEPEAPSEQPPWQYPKV